LAFVLQMIDESLALGRRVGTYTSMLGLHSTLAPVLARLRQLADAVEAHGSDVFAQGRMTRSVVWWRVAAKPHSDSSS
jgi:23S rRNA A1618 N6-methylase RlmF